MDGPNSGSHMDRDRERTLVDRARSDAAAFGELYDFYLPRIFGFVQRRVRERSVAEDLTATTFQRAREAIRYRDFRNDAFGGWLYRVAANSVVDHVRHGRRLVDLSGTDVDGGGGDAFAAAPHRAELGRGGGGISAEDLRGRLLSQLPDRGAAESDRDRDHRPRVGWSLGQFFRVPRLVPAL